MNLADRKTIAAVATGMTNAGISIIRISGEKAIEIADLLFVSKNGIKKLAEAKTHTMHYGMIYADGLPIDEVLVSVMRAPHTYTKEDIVEINCHGGILVTKKILDLVLSNGAFLAAPGEFTKRAFLNGRIDLSQAEAVMDLIQATNEQAVKNSAGQLSGSLYRKINEIRETVLRDTAFIEAAIDDPEHIDLDGFSEKLKEHTELNLLEIERLIATAEDGKIIKEGVRTVILGKPNVGKSTLLNALIGEERAIVTDIPGTTRDTLEELIQLKDVTLRLMDTAGIRAATDMVEKIGVQKAQDAAEQADLIIYVIDASVPFDENDKKIIELIQDKKVIVLLNKSDLPPVITLEQAKKCTKKQVFSISAKQEKGMDTFIEAVRNLFYQGVISSPEGIFITNLRQKQALKEAEQSLKQVMASIENNMPEDFYSIDLMNAYQALGEIIGETVEEDLINKIFQEFCMGK